MSSRAPRFLIDPRKIESGRVLLEPDEAKHAQVRRLRSGVPVQLFDGHGQAFAGRVVRCSKDSIVVEITEQLPEDTGESALGLTLALAVLKSERIEWAIEKSTELGVTSIRPFTSELSLARPSPSRCARWQQIARSAAKQCGRSVVPVLHHPVSFDEVLALGAEHRLLFSVGAAQTLAPAPSAGGSILIVVGPEGGLSEAEVESARVAGFELVGLGSRVLRAETAAVVAVTLCQHLWGDL